VSAPPTTDQDGLAAASGAVEESTRKPRASIPKKPRATARKRAAGQKRSTRKQRSNQVLHTLQIVGKQKKHWRYVLARAALELADPTLRIGHSGVDWDHWIARWPEMIHAEREYVARREIWPLLETRPDDRDRPPDFEIPIEIPPVLAGKAGAIIRELIASVERAQITQEEADDLAISSILSLVQSYQGRN